MAAESAPIGLHRISTRQLLVSRRQLGQLRLVERLDILPLEQSDNRERNGDAG